jgi:subtilase family serine protease
MPVEIGKRFGVSSHDVRAVTLWLQSQTLHVDSISNSRERVLFSGSASVIANAFGVEMHYFMVDGEKRISITAEPQIPAALGKVIKSISGLYTIRLDPQHGAETIHRQSHNIASDSGSGALPPGTFSCNGNPCYFIFPADFATIYNINGVGGGIDGTGQTIAIVGRSRVYDPDIQNFESLSGLTVKNPPEAVIVPPNGFDPGPSYGVCAIPPCASEDQLEATLDVTRSSSVAPGAAIDLVVSLSNPTHTKDGIQFAAEYVVDTAPVPAQIMSISFGQCEANAGQAGVTYWDSLFTQAAAEGISVFVSSGDSAAAGCDKAFTTSPVNQFPSPNSICSSGYATCVGGTEFADFNNPSQYWNANNGNGFESAIGYIPEGAWNEPINSQGQIQVAGTGGGVSAYVLTPPWQTGPGVPSARAGRYTPDIAFSASGHDGYFMCLTADGFTCANNPFPFGAFYGTSAAAPDMAGITALLNQKQGSAQGLLNPNLYNLAATPSNGIFNDVTVASSGVTTNCVITTPSMCNNSTASPTGLTGGLNGYLVGTGYDEATGLGSINVANLLTNWNSSNILTTTTLNIAPASPVNFGTSIILTATVQPTLGTSTPTGTVTFSDPIAGQLGPAQTLNNSGVATFTISALAASSYSITATYSPNAGFAGSASSPAVPLNVQDFQVAASPTTVFVTAPGQSGTAMLAITPLGGFNQAVTYSCSGLPSEATCTFTATSATTETLTVQTTPPSARLNKVPSGRSSGFFYALLLPGVLGLVVSSGSHKRTLNGGRLIALIAVLVVSTLWMPACGGGSSSKTPSNPGTPVGSTLFTVTASAGSLQPKSVQITLAVQ